MWLIWLLKFRLLSIITPRFLASVLLSRERELRCAAIFSLWACALKMSISVLSLFSCKKFSDIHWLISLMHLDTPGSRSRTWADQQYCQVHSNDFVIKERSKLITFFWGQHFRGMVDGGLTSLSTVEKSTLLLLIFSLIILEKNDCLACLVALLKSFSLFL